MTRSEFGYITETWFHVKLSSDPANLLTKWISLSGVLQLSTTSQTQERIWPILSFALQKLVTINQFISPEDKEKYGKKNRIFSSADFFAQTYLDKTPLWRYTSRTI